MCYVSSIAAWFEIVHAQNVVKYLQVPDVEKFMADYNMQCPMAAKRLIYSGMPATVEHGKPRCACVLIRHIFCPQSSLSMQLVCICNLPLAGEACKNSNFSALLAAPSFPW